LFDGLSAMPSGGPVPEPPPSRTTSARAKRAARGEGYHDYEDPYADRWKMWATVAALGSLMLLAGGVYAFFHFDGIGQVRHHWARAHLDAWAQQRDGTPPGRPHSGTPDAKIWTYAYFVPGGGQKKKNEPPAGPNAELLAKKELLDLLNSALLTAAVTPETIKTGEQAQRLIDTCSRLISGELQVADFGVLGATLPPGDEPTLVIGWVNALLAERFSKKETQAAEPLAAVSDWVQRLLPLAALFTNSDPAVSADTQPILEDSIRQALELVIGQPPLSEKDLKEFTIQVVKNPSDYSDAKTLGALRKAFRDSKTPPEVVKVDGQKNVAEPGSGNQPPLPADPTATRPDGTTEVTPEQRQAAWKNFLKRLGDASSTSRPLSTEPKTITLVNGIQDSNRIDWTRIEVILGTVQGTWKPRATKVTTNNEEPAWDLQGLPDDLAKQWGTLRLTKDTKQGEKRLVFEPTEDMPWYCRYVPFVLVQRGGQPESTEPVWIATKPEAFPWEATAGATKWRELLGIPADLSMAAVESGSDEIAGPTNAFLRKAELKAMLGLPLNPSAFTVQFAPRPQSLLQLQRLGDPRSDASVDSILLLSINGVRLAETITFRQQMQDKAISVVISGVGNIAKLLEPGTRLPSGAGGGPLTGAHWESLVRRVLEAMLPEGLAQKLPVSELRRRLGVEPINNRAEQEKALGKVRDKIKRVEQSGPEQSQVQLALLKKQESEQIARITRSRQEEHAYSPWPGPSDPKKPLSIVQWKDVAIDYLTGEERLFSARFGQDDVNEMRKAAKDPVFIQEFLAREREWVINVAESFGGKSEGKAEQNEFIALLVLAHLDGMILVQQDAEAVRKAFDTQITELLEATVSIPWTFEGSVVGAGPVIVPTARIAGVQGRSQSPEGQSPQ
jgi:hypothetical protein